MIERLVGGKVVVYRVWHAVLAAWSSTDCQWNSYKLSVARNELKKTSWSLNISLSQLHKSNNLNLRWRNSNNFLSILVFSGQNPLDTNVLPGSFPEEVEVANLLRTCYGETGVMGSSSMKSYSREWTPESAVGLVTGHWWQTWLMMSITSVILPAETHHC